jgi:hypothetical protein
MKTEICGISFNEMPNSLWTDNLELSIYGTADDVQSFQFGIVEIGPFVELFGKFKVASLAVSIATPTWEKFDLDLITHVEHLRRFHINAHNLPVQVKYTEGKGYFPDLKALSILGECPESFPDLRHNVKLTELTIQYDRHFLEHWIDLPQIKDLTIYDYDEADLTPLSKLINVVRLKIVRGTMKSLDGLEDLPALRTLVVVTAAKLVDLSAIVRSVHLHSVMFEMYKKVTDWSFLAQKRNMHQLALDVVDSVDFKNELPDLTFLYVKKLKEHKNRSYFFENEGRFDDMKPEGINVSYIPDHDVFYEKIAN